MQGRTEGHDLKQKTKRTVLMNIERVTFLE